MQLITRENGKIITDHLETLSGKDVRAPELKTILRDTIRDFT